MSWASLEIGGFGHSICRCPFERHLLGHCSWWNCRIRQQFILNFWLFQTAIFMEQDYVFNPIRCFATSFYWCRPGISTWFDKLLDVFPKIWSSYNQIIYSHYCLVAKYYHLVNFAPWLLGFYICWSFRAFYRCSLIPEIASDHHSSISYCFY